LKEFLKEMLNESSAGFENLQLVSANGAVKFFNLKNTFILIWSRIKFKGSIEIKLDIFERLLDPNKDFKHSEFKVIIY